MSDQEKIKFKIMKSHRSKLDDLGIQVEDNSGYWYLLRITFPDGEVKYLNHPFKTFNAVTAAIVEYLSKLRTKNLIAEKAELEAQNKALSLKEEVSKNSNDILQVVAALTTIIGTPVGIGIGLASLSKDTSSISSNPKEKNTPVFRESYDDGNGDG